MVEVGLIFKMKSEVYNSNLDKLSKEVIQNFFDKIKRLAKDDDKIFIALSGGTSLNNFYENLLKFASNLEQKFWSKIIFCFADERIVPLYNQDSNYRQLKETFLNKLIEKKNISENQIIKINPNSKNPQIEYSNLISRVDIFLFGSGPDCHIASLFPHHNLLNEKSKKFLIIENSPKPPKKRITISKKMIENSEVSFIFFIGKNKQKAYDNFRNKNLSFKNCPAKLALNSKNCFVVTNLK